MVAHTSSGLGCDDGDVAVSDTRQGGAVALPLHIRQTAGPTLTAAGGGLGLLGAGLVVAAVARRRRRG